MAEMTKEEIEKELIYLFKQLSDMTNPECKSCRVPLSCCSPEYCDLAQEYAKESWGVDLVPAQPPHRVLPFMGPQGCIVEPHLRPLCTFHTCNISSLGYKKNDMEWTDRYFSIRDMIEELEALRDSSHL